jgi:cobalamin biosynthesis protein CobD/CbiB
MQHPVFYLARVTKFLDRLIQEQGDYLFAGFVVVCAVVLVWMFTRRRKHPVHEISVVILPLGLPPKRESSPEPVMFREHSDF